VKIIVVVLCLVGLVACSTSPPVNPDGVMSQQKKK
jgi:hypothetical protein